MYDWSAGDKGLKEGKRTWERPDTQGELSDMKNGLLHTPLYLPQILVSIICCMNYYTSFHLVPAAIFMPLNLFLMQEIMSSLLKIFYCFLPYWKSYSTYFSWPMGDIIYPYIPFDCCLYSHFLQSHWPFFPSWNLHIHSCLWAFALAFLLFYLSSFFSSSICSDGPLIKEKFWAQFNVLFCVFNNKYKFLKWSPVFIFFL